MENKPMMERLFPPFPTIFKPNGKDAIQNEDDDMLTDNFDYGSEGEPDILCNMIFALPIEYDQIT